MRSFRTNTNFWVVLGIAAFVSAGVRSAGAAENWTYSPIDQRQTSQGILQIDQVGEFGHRVSLDGHFLAEIESGSVKIERSVASSDGHEYILLNVSKGGGSCQELYCLLALSPGRKPHLTGEFGNCTTDPDLRLQDDGVAIDFKKSSESKARAYTYHAPAESLKSNWPGPPF